MEYIIEIPDDLVQDYVREGNLIMPYIMARHVGHHDTGLNVHPYTGPDIEEIRKSAFDEVRELLNQAQENINAAFEKGKAIGRMEAWNAARKIILLEADGGLGPKRAYYVFGFYTALRIMRDNTADEAIEKISSWEKQHDADG